MNIIEHLLVCITEECGEIIQAADKALRFGLDDHAPGKNQTNLEDLVKEVNDLVAVIEVLDKSGVTFSGLFSRDDIEAKKKKIQHFLEYAVSRGTTQEE